MGSDVVGAAYADLQLFRTSPNPSLHSRIALRAGWVKSRELPPAFSCELAYICYSAFRAIYYACCQAWDDFIAEPALVTSATRPDWACVITCGSCITQIRHHAGVLAAASRARRRGKVS